MVCYQCKRSLTEVFLWTSKGSMRRKTGKSGTKGKTWDQVALQEAFAKISMVVVDN